MAFDLSEQVSTIASVVNFTEFPIDDSDDSTECELVPLSSSFICGQPAQYYNIYNRHLPYASALEKEAANYLKEIKANLGKSILLSVHKSDWAMEVKAYLSLYGAYFTKEDHILFIKMFLQAMQIPGIEMSTLTAMISILISLLRKRRLISPKELTIEWRPLYDIYCKYIFERKNLFQIGQSYGFESKLRSLIEIARNYFPIEATREILDELRPVQCPFTACKIFRCSFLLGLFLPTQMFPEHHDQGFKLWFEEILALWSGPNAIQYENIFFKLLARLATHNVGYIDWTPYMSTIFTKYTKAMNNSVNSSPFAILALTTDSDSMVKWMVSMIGGPNSKALQYIESLFKAVESNYHPSNMSRWSSQLNNIISKLSSAFIDRIYREKYRKKSWEPLTPKEYQITEEDIDKFVDILTPILYTAMFCRFGAGSIFTAIKDLARLRPEKVIPPLVEKLYIALESNLEAHRLNSLMSAMASVGPSMTNGFDRYEEGKTHLIGLLFSSLPGLDCNDIRKCVNTFGLVASLLDCVPIMDCSPMVDIRDDLTELEYNIALETARFEEFVLIFLEKVLTLVENYSPEHRPEKIDNDSIKQSSEESHLKSIMASSLSTVLYYSSPQIFEKALDKLFVFLRGRLFESRSTIKFMASVCEIFALAQPKIVLEKFLPYLHSTILALTDNEDVFEEDSVDGQLSLALQIAAAIIVVGDFITPHEERLFDIIRRGLRLKPSQGYKPAAYMLKHCLSTLTIVCPKTSKVNGLCLSWDQLYDFKNVNPIRLWGKYDKLDDIVIDWHMPSDEDMLMAQKLLDEFLVSELNSLCQWTKGEITLTREEVHRSLNVVLFCVEGSFVVFPPFESEEYVILDTPVPPPRERVHEFGRKILTLSSGINPRQFVATSTQTVLKHIMSSCDDDTRSLDIIIKIYHRILGWIRGSSIVEIDQDDYHTMKKIRVNKLAGPRKLPRRLLIDRVRMQHRIRLWKKTWGKFTITHRDLVMDLFALAVSHYSNVRAAAHSTLSLFKHPFIYRMIASELTKVFSKPRTGETEEIQGALSILLSHHFMSISDWECVTPLWLALINTDYSEKPTIIALLEQLSKHAATKLQPLLIEFKVSPELFEIGQKFFTVGVLPDVPMPNENEIAKGQTACDLANKMNLDIYKSFVHSLVDSIESGRLHWRHLQFAFLFLQSLIRKDINFPVEGVRVIVKNLIDDHVAIRRICINSVAAILRQHKPTIQFDHIMVNLKSESISDFDWLYFKPDVNYMDEAIWKSTKWVNRTYISPTYCPSGGIKYYTETSALPSRNLETLGPEEALILEFFLDKDKVAKLLEFLTLDDKRRSLLGPRRFKLFQGLFRNFGITTLHAFQDFFEKMTSETKENIHKCGCDVLTGLVRGSKYWPYKDIVALRDMIEPVMKKLLRTISRETTEHYVEFCTFGFRRLDGRRFSWLFSYLIEDPLCSLDKTATSFQSFSHLKILSDLLISQCWRAIPYLRHLFDHIMKHNHLKNPYQNIRQLIGCSLTQLLQFDNDFFNASIKTLTGAPKIDELLTSVLAELEAASTNYPSSSLSSPSSSSQSPTQASSESSDSSMAVVDSSGNLVEDVEKESCNLLTTLCYWLHPHLSLNPHITRPQILQLVPIICEIIHRSKDDELIASANDALNSIGQCSIKDQYIDSALAVCNKMTGSKSWHTRVSVVNFIQLMVSSNLFTLMNDANRNKTVINMIIGLLQDDRTEVREKAAGLLGGLVHYQFIKVDKPLINQFKAKCARKLTRSNENYGYDNAELNEKHGGALGLCSIVSAYPYDVPEYLPDILMFLGDHLHDPQPIPTTIRKTLSDFKRTHHDNWRQHKEKFNEDQLAIITDLLVSPNYYA